MGNRCARKSFHEQKITSDEVAHRVGSKNTWHRYGRSVEEDLVELRLLAHHVSLVEDEEGVRRWGNPEDQLA